MEHAPFDLERLLAETFVGSIHFEPTMASTNDKAAELLRADALITPLLILTERQLAGRGRGANRWWSREGSLTFSLVLQTTEQELPMTRWSQISLIAGLAVCQTLQHLQPGIAVGLKWPNDVFVRDRKICGVLVEVPSSATGRVVVGIGININNSFTDAPVELRDIATSMIDETQRRLDITDVLVRLLQQMETQWNSLAKNHDHCARIWDDYCVLTERQIALVVADREVRGRCLGIDQNGALRIDTGNGIEHHVAGHVRSFH